MKDVESIYKMRLCIGCGICESIAGRQNIRLRLDDDGFFRPHRLGIVEDFWADIRNVCPALSVRQPEKGGTAQEKLWGPIQKSLVGFAVDEQIRYLSSSGGVITALLCCLLDSGEISAAVHVGKSETDPSHNETGVSRNKTDILRRAGSRYSPSSPLTVIRELLENRKERIAFVGRPCDTAALYAFLSFHPEFRNQVVYLISFFCAGTPSQKGTIELLSRLGVEPANLKDFWYRGHGWPGETTAVLLNDTTKTMNYNESWGNILNRHLHLRCKVCPDGMGSFADITCGDAWWEFDGLPSFEEKPGQSLTLARTSHGDRALLQAVKKGYLRLAPYDLSALERIQNYQKNRKRVVAARLLALRLSGIFYPRFSGFHLWHNALKAGPRNNLTNFWGMLRRIKEMKRSFSHHSMEM